MNLSSDTTVNTVKVIKLRSMDHRCHDNTAAGLRSRIIQYNSGQAEADRFHMMYTRCVQS